MNEQFFLPLFQAVDSTSQKKLRDHFYKLAIRYAVVRAQWNFISVRDKIETNDERIRIGDFKLSDAHELEGLMAGITKESLVTDSSDDAEVDQL